MLPIASGCPPVSRTMMSNGKSNVLPLTGRIVRQREHFYLVRVEQHEPAPTIDLAEEHVHGHRWWTLDELESTDERLAPRALATHARALLCDGPEPEPIDLAV